MAVQNTTNRFLPSTTWPSRSTSAENSRTPQTIRSGNPLGSRNGHHLDGLEKLVDGWLDTGDLARIDDDGFTYLTGCAKDLIIRGGHNIDPAIVEDALLAHPQVTAASAVGRPDAHAGEVPVAYVTLAPHATVTAEQLRESAAGRVSSSRTQPPSPPE